MIRIATQPPPVPAWHAGFLALLPAILRQASRAFRHLKPEARQDAIVEVVANAMVAYARLCELGKESIAYASPLARYGIAQFREGRRVGNRSSARDVLSQYAQQRKGLVVERLDRYDAAEGVWCEALVEDRQAGPAETAAARIDVGDWLGLLSSRDRRIAAALAAGGTTGEVAVAFRLSPSRVSQMRKEYRESWREFQGEEEKQDGTLVA